MDKLTQVIHRANNFDFVRLVAATLVLYSHCFALTGQGGGEPLVQATVGQYSFGGLAVRVFFVISGFLVMQSWLRRPRMLSFTGARCLRIFPGLAVALVYCVAISAVATNHTVIDFLTRRETFAFYWHNLILQTEFYLPGVFEHNVEPRAVNGSLWTLHYEVRAYLIVLGLGIVGAFHRRWLGTLAWLIIGALIFAWPIMWGRPPGHDWPVINLFACFIAAALVALYGVSVRWLGWMALLSGVALAFTIKTDLSDIALDVLLVTGTLWFAQQQYRGISSAGRFGDFSYGIFIYAFPTQQLVEWLTDTRSPYLMLALSLPLTLLFAIASWWWVEKPCLELKRVFDRSRRVAVPAGVA